VKRTLAALLALLFSIPAAADDWQIGSRALHVLDGMFVQNGKSFGFVGYAADPFTCDATTVRATYYNTVSNTIYFCNGTAWTVVAGGGSSSATASWSAATGKGLTISSLSTPSAPTATPQGTTGATTYGYKITAVLSDGTTESAASAEGTTATGNATLDGTNFNRVTWSAVTSAISYNVYRTTGTPGGGSAPPRKIASLTTALTYDDIGTEISGTTPPVFATTATIGQAVFRNIAAGGGVRGFLSISGTMTDSATAIYGVDFNITTAGTLATIQGAQRILLNSGYTGSGTTYGLNASNGVAGTGNNIAVNGISQGTAGNLRGVFGNGDSTGSANAVGVLGTAGDHSTNYIGGQFEIGTGAPVTGLTTALYANNQSKAFPIAIFSDNSAALPTTGPTATVQVKDGAQLQYGLGVLTSGTATAETQAIESGSLIHSCTWTNAQVAALAGTAGDISCFTLPAKTVVKNVYLIILTSGGTVTTLTAAVGRTGAGYIDYIVASDAKAAANTVYGDAVAERGTNLVGYDLPSYTGTTVVNIHFISTGGNLSTVTTSTGRVVIETSLIP